MENGAAVCSLTPDHSEEFGRAESCISRCSMGRKHRQNDSLPYARDRGSNRDRFASLKNCADCNCWDIWFAHAMVKDVFVRDNPLGTIGDGRTHQFV